MLLAEAGADPPGKGVSMTSEMETLKARLKAAAAAAASIVGRREAEDGWYATELDLIDGKYRLNGCSLKEMRRGHGRLARLPHGKG